jgi:hypothetical protein
MNLDSYPRTKKFLEEHPGMSLDDAYQYMKKNEAENANKTY